MKTQVPMIKSKGFNEIRKVLKPNGRKGAKSTLSVEEQYQLIENIVNEISNEIRNYKFDRKEKRKIERLRLERGYKHKKKTTKDEYLNSIKTV